MAVEEDIPDREWVPLEGGEKEKSPDTKGTWVQRASFRSTIRLDCPHTFATDNIICGVWLPTFILAVYDCKTNTGDFCSIRWS